MMGYYKNNNNNNNNAKNGYDISYDIIVEKNYIQICRNHCDYLQQTSTTKSHITEESAFLVVACELQIYTSTLCLSCDSVPRSGLNWW